MSNFLEETYAAGTTLSADQVRHGLHDLLGAKVGQIGYDILMEDEETVVRDRGGVRWKISAVRGGYRVE